MKKVYSKPEILFEDFTLSTNIATTCEHNPLSSETTCAIDYSGWNLFLVDMAACTDIQVGDPGDEDGQYGKICYHVPTGENVFMS